MNALETAWLRAGTLRACNGIDMFRGSSGEGPPLVLFHGFPSFSLDWRKLVPLLAGRRVLYFDFPGYGFSGRPHDYSYSLVDQFSVTEELLAQEGIREFDLVCHDMGCSVACEFFHRLATGATPLRLRRVVFLNGSVYMEMARPLITQRLLRHRLLGPLLARFASRRLFERQFSCVFADPAVLSADETQAYWNALTRDRSVLPRLAGYMNERLRRADRWLPPLRALAAPALILWGRQDPVAVPGIAERLHQDLPRSRLVWLDEVGHYPQLEAPEVVAGHIGEFLDRPATPG